jgi:hypothetical protein
MYIINSHVTFEDIFLSLIKSRFDDGKNYVTLGKISLPHVTFNDIIAPPSHTFYFIGPFSTGFNSSFLSWQMRQNTNQNFTNQLFLLNKWFNNY